MKLSTFTLPQQIELTIVLLVAMFGGAYIGFKAATAHDEALLKQMFPSQWEHHLIQDSLRERQQEQKH